MTVRWVQFIDPNDGTTVRAGSSTDPRLSYSRGGFITFAGISRYVSGRNIVSIH